MKAFEDADPIYGRIVELARQAKIDENKIKAANLIYWNVRCLYRPARENDKRVPAFAAAIEAASARIMEALDATPDMDDLITAVREFPAELTGVFGIDIDFDTAVITAYGEEQSMDAK